MEFGGARKRAKQDSASNGNGNYKKSKQEMDSPGIGSKMKPCTKFYSTSGCQFGDGCHFSHHVPGGFKAITLLNNFGGNPAHQQSGRNSVGPQSYQDGPSPPVKSRLCAKFNSAEGCRFSDKCRFAHGDWELGKPALPSYEDPRAMGPMHGRYGGNRNEPSLPGHGARGSFGASATAKISVDASLGGAIIGKSGVHTKQICHVTGAKLSVRDHESDPNLKNIELEGTFDQIKQASEMVHELIVNLGSTSGQPMRRNNHTAPAYGSSSSSFKTKLCEKFAKGTCTFGEKCHFAHGEDELRKSGL